MLVRRLVRFSFHPLYNRFAFAYDPVSRLVSGGEWRAWVCAALPFLRGPAVLELAFGTGQLQLALWQSGFQPSGLDLSPYMVGLTRLRLACAGFTPRLVRGRVPELPFPPSCFDDLVVTFPAPFILEPASLSALARLLRPAGRLVWVDGGRLKPVGLRARFLKAALDLSGGSASPPAPPSLPLPAHAAWLSRLPAGPFDWEIQRVDLPRSTVSVILGTPNA